MHYFNPDKVNTSDFDMRDISADELQGMFAAGEYYLQNGSKREKRLARKLLQAARWIEREAYYNDINKNALPLLFDTGLLRRTKA